MGLQHGNGGGEDAKQLLGEVWETLRMIVMIDNAFIEQMSESNDLSETDQLRFVQWRNALAKAHEPVMRAQERIQLSARPVRAN